MTGRYMVFRKAHRQAAFHALFTKLIELVLSQSVYKVVDVCFSFDVFLEVLWDASFFFPPDT
jgi:DNA gyrase inhibitor GyrI